MTLGTILISLAVGLSVLLLFLIGFVILKTTLFSPSQKEVKPRDFVIVDGKSIGERLGLAVQFKTISHHDLAAFDANAFYGLHRLYKTLYPQVHAQLKLETVNDYSLLYTWGGKDPTLKPIMLTSHLDVVPVDESEWDHPPFGGELIDEYVWGRGTIDDKAGVIGILEAVEYLLKQGFQPQRTVYLGFGHDEEVGGTNGAKAISELLESRGVKLGSLLDEGGSVIEGYLPGVETPVGAIGISEKGYLSLKLTAAVEGGHSSMPPQETAIGILSKAITKLESNPMPAHLEVVSFVMGFLGSALPFTQRMLFANTWLFGGILKNQLAKSNLLNASIRTTTAPTMINAGDKDNILPSKAEAVVNFRLLPGDDLRTVYEIVLEKIKDDRIKVTPYQGETLEGESGWNPSPVADIESPFYLKLSRLIKEAFPKALISPYLVLGGTDSRWYVNLTTNIFRFQPIQMTREEMGTVHGINERISLENCTKLVGFYIAYIEELGSVTDAFDNLEEVEKPLLEEEEDIPIPSLEETMLSQFDDEDIPIPTLEEAMSIQLDDEDIPDIPEDKDMPDLPDDVGKTF